MVRPEVNSITKSDTFREIPSSIFFNHYWNLKVPLFDFHITVLSRLHESDIIYLKMSVCGKVWSGLKIGHRTEIFYEKTGVPVLIGYLYV